MLRPQDLVVEQADSVEHTQALRLGQLFCLHLLLLEDGAAEPQLASGHDRLLHKAAVFAAGGVCTDLLAAIAHSRIGVEAGLQRTPGSRLHLSSRLSEGGISFQGHRFELFERERGRGRL